MITPKKEEKVAANDEPPDDLMFPWLSTIPKRPRRKAARTLRAIFWNLWHDLKVWSKRG
jgi:hypothetical protein